jgi:hypothetical protein
VSWVQEVHKKAHILQAQLEAYRGAAISAGLNPDEVTAPLFKEIDSLYETEFPLAKAMDESDLIVHLEGPALSDHTPRLALIESVFANLRQQILSVARAVANLGDGARLSEADVDLSLSALAPGSLYVGIRAESPISRDGQRHLLGEQDPILEATRKAIRSISIVSQHLRDDSDAVISEIPDANVRDAALLAVARLAPTKQSGVRKVTLSSAIEGQAIMGVGLTTKIRTELRQQIRSSRPTGTRIVTYQGEIREIDLDFDRFELRRLEESPTASIRCILLADAAVDLKNLAGKRVQVTATIANDISGLPNVIHVRRVDLIGPTGVTTIADLPFPQQ